MFLKTNVVVITSPGPEQVKDDEYLYVKISYRPRWLTYIMGSGTLTLLVLLLFRFCNFFQPSHLNGSGTQTTNNQEQLIPPKDDDTSSWGSSYDSVSNDEEELDELLHEQGNQQPTEGETRANSRKLRVICFDSPRDCFFLPCGHYCVACLPCGSRIAEEAGTCHICRRRMKKVRKIFSVCDP